MASKVYLAVKVSLGRYWMMQKRNQTITIKATLDDVKLFERAGNELWPGAPVTRSSLVLELAKMGAERALKEKRVRKAD